MQEEGALFSKNKTNLQQKLPQGGKTGRQLKQGGTQTHKTTYDTRIHKQQTSTGLQTLGD